MKSFSVAAVLTSLARDGGSLAYNAVSVLGAPFFLYRKWRLLKSTRIDCEFDPARWMIQFPRALEPQSKRETAPKNGPRVVFITLGWGEVATMEPLVKALRVARPNAQLIFTVKHREAIPLASELADEEVLPLPFDRPLPVSRWHARARPDVVIFYERFKLVTLLRSLWLQRVPFAIVHARMSAKRANNRSALNLKFKRWQLRGLRDILLPTPDYLPGTQQIAPAEAGLHVVGSVKFPHAKPQMAPEREAELRAWIEAATAGKAPLLIAGSTHETEEAFVLQAWEKTRANCPENSPVLLLAPRKPYRTDEILQLLNERNLRVSRRSQWNSTKSERADVLLLDTLGELSVVYSHGVGAFLGGTIVGSSHNVAEPLIWNLPVAYGPKRGNFGVEQTLCESAGVGFRIETPDELAAHWTEIIQSPDLRAELSRKIEALLEKQSLAFEHTLKVLIETVDAVSKE